MGIYLHTDSVILTPTKTTMKTSILLLFLSSISAFCQTPELIFHSGFEPNVNDTTNGVSADIIGADNSLSSPNDWIFDLEAHPNIGKFNIQYQGGNDTMRFAKIIQDPTDSSNKVLQYWLKYPNVAGTKGRVQANLYGNTNLFEISQKVRLYLPADWNIIKNANAKIEWLTIMEFWNNLPFTDTIHPFRITLGIHKKDALSQKLSFNLKAQTMPNPPPWPIVWEESDTIFSVPVERWLTLEFYFKEGDSTNGRFIMAVTPDGGKREVIFNVTNFTHHPNDNFPDGLVKYNPMKLYTSDALLNYIRTKGGVLQVYWDDFELWKNIDLVTSIVSEKNIEKKIIIYPNPMRLSTTIEFENDRHENFTFILFNFNGQIVKTKSDITTGQIIIEKGDLNSGMYFFRLIDRNNESVTRKIIIE